MLTTKKLIDQQGQVQIGIFPKPVELINYQDYPLEDVMDRPVQPWKKYWKFNQFQFIGVLSPELVMGCAIVNLKIVSNAFIYFYHPASKTLKEYSFILPLALSTRFDLQPDAGTCSFRFGNNHFSIVSQKNPRSRQLKVNLSTGEKVDVTLDEDLLKFEPLPICTRAGYNGWVYTQKAAGVPVTGKILWQQGEFDVQKMHALGSYDWTAGFMRHETCWNWACLGTVLASGEKIGLNLACGVNETSFTENGFWVDGKFIKVDLAHFEFVRGDVSKPWHVHSQDGKVDLTFEPEGTRKEKMNAVLLATNFRQMMGRFRGKLSDGKRHWEIKDAYGFVEDHYAKW